MQRQSEGAQRAHLPPSLPPPPVLPARSGRPGPVLVDVPKDIQQQLGIPDWEQPLSIQGYIGRLPPAPEPAQLQPVLRALREAKKPVAYIGGGCNDAAPEVREFLERTGIPVATTLMGLGVVSGAHPQAMAMLGMHGTVYANYSVDQARARARASEREGWIDCIDWWPPPRPLLSPPQGGVDG